MNWTIELKGRSVPIVTMLRSLRAKLTCVHTNCHNQTKNGIGRFFEYDKILRSHYHGEMFSLMIMNVLADLLVTNTPDQRNDIRQYYIIQNLQYVII